MAEEIFTRKIDDLPTSLEIKANSAGLSALDGSEASPHAKSVIASEGGDLEDHRAKMLSQDLIDEVDLILTMTENHRRLLTEQYSVQSTPVYLLKEYASLVAKEMDYQGEGHDTCDKGDHQDIKDPIGGNEEDYRLTYREIEKAVRVIVDYLASGESVDPLNRDS